MIGTTLGNRYKLVAELGSGGMAWVYLGEDLRSGSQVAVKVLYPQLSHEAGFLQRFVQEARLAMSLSAGPQLHVARVLDYGSDRDTHYLVMEYVDGRDLRRVLDEDGPLSWQEAFDVGRQVALALAHAHRHGIVHRDIKPGNVMLVRDGSVRVLDFGVARARNSPSLTQSGFVGSPYYAAPEQAMGRAVDIRADLYSLGVVLCEMLTGKLPFEADTPWGVISQHIATPPPLLDESYPHIPGPVARVVRQAMAKRPEDRFQTPAEMAQTLENVLLGVEPSMELLPADPGVLAPLLEGLYQRAEEATGAGLWQEAVDLFNQILKLDPCYRDVAERLAEAGRQVRLAALYAGARRSLKAGQWAETLGQLDEIAETMPDYRDVRELRVRARQKYELDQLYRQGIQHLEVADWAAAIDCLAEVQAREPNYARTAELLATARAELERERRPAAPRPRLIIPLLARERARPRSLVWAVVAVLLAALVVETWMVVRAWQSPETAPTLIAPVASRAPQIGLNPAPVALSSVLNPVTGPAVHPSPTALVAVHTGLPTPARPAATRPSRVPQNTPLPTATPSPSAAWPAVAPSATAGPTTAPNATAGLTTAPSATAALQSGPVPTREPPPSGQIAFPRFDPQRGTYDVYVCRVDGSHCRRVAPECSQPDLLPKGSQLVVHSWDTESKGLEVRSLEGRLVWRLTDVVEAARPSVDARGEFYVYQSRQQVDRLPRLVRMAGLESQPILQGASPVIGHSPAWLSDGRIVYSGCVGNACGILIIRADGTGARQVVAGGRETNPEPSPDGRALVFMSERDGNWEIYRVDVDPLAGTGGSNLRRLTRHAADDGLPTWSPDGRHIAFVSSRGGEWQVWIMAADGSDQRPLFAIGGPLDGVVRNAAAHETHGWVEERISWGPLP